MQRPERFSDLPEYAFPRLRALIDGLPAGGDVLAMSIGEPTHPIPPMVADIIARTAADFGRYPPNDGTLALREAIAGWLSLRFGAELDPAQHVCPLNGTREGLFNAALAIAPEVKRGQKPAILIPNPFYQVYAVAALEVGAEPVFVPATAETGFLPDYAALPDEVLDRTVIAYICSPSNPQGAVASADYLAALLALAEKHDFTVFADECYSEIYRDTPPPGILTAVRDGGFDPNRALAFHSLSKRSSLPGLRSGFAAGGAGPIALIKQLRAYAGAPLPFPLQHAAAEVWSDEQHVNENRALYRVKYGIADKVFGSWPGYRAPEAGFFLWLNVGDGEAMTKRIWTQTGVRVLPGAYLSRSVDGIDPGAAYIRVALVGSEDDVKRGLLAIHSCL